MALHSYCWTYPHPFVSGEGNERKRNALLPSGVLDLVHSPLWDGHSLSRTSLWHLIQYLSLKGVYRKHYPIWCCFKLLSVLLSSGTSEFCTFFFWWPLRSLRPIRKFYDPRQLLWRTGHEVAGTEPVSGMSLLTLPTCSLSISKGYFALYENIFLHTQRKAHSAKALVYSFNFEKPTNFNLLTMIMKIVPTFADRRYHVVSVTDPYGHILDFLDRSR
jgi:hypothetical protein